MAANNKFWKKLDGKKGQKRRRQLHARSALQLEALEERHAPAVSAAFAGGFSIVADAPVNVSQMDNDQTQPNIAVDPTNPARMFAVSNTFAGPLFGAYSTNAGQTWVKRNLATGADGLPAAASDAQLAWDNYGNLFLAYVKSGVKSVVVAASTDGGQTFTVKLNTGNDFCDQPTLAVGANSVWIAYQCNGIVRVNAASVSGLGNVGGFGIERTMSGFGDFPAIAVAPTGQATVAWSTINNPDGPETIYVATDPDGLGINAFGPAVTVTSTNIGFYDEIPSMPINGINPTPDLAYDALGRAYLVYTDEVVNESNDTNIYVRTSDDYGATWSLRKKVNDDATSRSQFLPSIAVDGYTGFVAIGWHDCRGSAANTHSKIYGTVSVDRGASWLANQVVGPHEFFGGSAPGSLELGDFAGLSFVGGSFFPIWADNSNGTGDNPEGGSGSLDLVTARARIQSIGGQTVTMTGTGGNDVFDIRLDASGTYVLFYENDPYQLNKPAFVATKAALAKIVISGGAGLDSLRFSMLGGNPIPNGGIQFDGGADSDSIVVYGGNGYVLTDVSLGVTGSVGGVVLASVESASLGGHAGANSFYVGSWTGTAYLGGGSGADTYQVVMNSSAAHYSINDDGASGVDALTVTNAPGGAMSVTATTLTVATETIQYAGIDALTLHASGSNNVFNVATTSSKTNIVGNTNTSIVVGNAGTLSGIGGILNLENPTSFNSIVLDDSTNFLSKAATFSSFQPNPDDSQGSSLPWGKITGLAPFAIHLKYADTKSLAIKGGVGGNTFHINSFAQIAGCTTTIESGSGFDTFNLSAAGLGTTGSLVLKGQGGKDAFHLQTMPSPNVVVKFDGGGGVDSFHTSGGYAEWNINAVDSTYVELASQGKVAFNAIENLHSSIAADTFFVNSTAPGSTTNIIANNFAGNSLIYIANGSAQGIQGTLNVENHFGYNFILIDNSADVVGRTVHIDSFVNNPDSPNPDSLIWLKIHGLAPADINVKMDYTGLDIAAGSGADTFYVSANLAALFSINGGQPTAPNLIVVDKLYLDNSNAVGPLMTPTANGAGQWSFFNQAGVWFANFERLNPGVAVSGRVYRDLDNNGNDNGGIEPGMAGVTVTLDSNADGVADLTTITLADGSYAFTDLAPGDYRVRQIVPTGYTQSSTNPADLNYMAPMNNTGWNFGNVDFTLPTITGLFFDGTTWSPNFRSALGFPAYGHRAQVGAHQFDSMPWSTINAFHVHFSEDVQIDAGDLQVRGFNVANYPIANMTYDAVQHVAKFTLATPIDTDRLLFDLDGNSFGAVRDHWGNLLAGNWIDGASTFPTSGAPGDFQFRFVVGVGDVDRNGMVRNADLNAVRNNLFVDYGQIGYNVFADIDGNGQVRNADLNAVRNHLFVDPPAGPGPMQAMGGGARSRDGGRRELPAARRFESDRASRVDMIRPALRPHVRPVAASLDALFAEF